MYTSPLRRTACLNKCTLTPGMTRWYCSSCPLVFLITTHLSFFLDKEPWSTVPKTEFRAPKNCDFVKEVRRRAKAFKVTPLPRPTNWTRSQIIKWLETNPVSEPSDVDFLVSEVSRVHDVYQRMRSEQRDIRNSSAGRGRTGHWRGNVPYMRIIMTLTQDNVKCLFLTRANSRSRVELDARNPDVRCVCALQLCNDVHLSLHFILRRTLTLLL
jgi:hypothetical protein